MQIWHYHPVTGRQLGVGLAAPSPLEPEVWLIPAHATATPPPEPDEGHEVVYEAGAWVQRIAEPPVVPPAPPAPPPAQLAVAARARRDALLMASDWTQLPDAPLTAGARAAWSDYRAALRAVPQQPGFPATIAWPVAPG